MNRTKNDSNTTLQDLKDAFVQFRDERGWGKHHKPKNLAMSIAIEAAELMEHFQWDDYGSEDKQGIADELADVLGYCISFAETMDIDIATAFFHKVEHNKKKYPVEIFSPNHDDAEAYRKIKAAYRKNSSK